MKSLSGLVFLADELSSFFHREGGYFDLQFFYLFVLGSLNSLTRFRISV